MKDYRVKYKKSVMSGRARAILAVVILAALAALVFSFERPKEGRGSPTGSGENAAASGKKEPQANIIAEDGPPGSAPEPDAAAKASLSPQKITPGRVGMAVLSSGEGIPARILLSNGMPSAITSARLWIFQTDEAGKVVNQKAQWLPKTGTEGSEVVLAANEAREFPLALSVRDEKYLKLTFSAMNFEDGSRPNIELILVEQ